MRCVVARWACAGLIWLASPSLAAQNLESPLQAETLSEAIGDGDPILLLQPRYTWVDQNGRPENARWASLRTQLGWKTLEWHDLSAVAEVIGVRHSTGGGYLEYAGSPAEANGVGGIGVAQGYGPGYYPLVVDPDVTDFNRLYLEYTGVPHTQLRLGRQVVRIDNQRFVGDYDSGQLPQLFNGFSAENQSLPRTRLTYAYFVRVRNPYGAQWQTRLNLLNGRYELGSALKLAGFAYLQDQPITGSVTGFANNSNRILGARAWGAWPALKGVELLYSAELAQQRSFAGGDSRIDAPYWRFGGGLSFEHGFARVDWERLGSNGGVYGFQTPLGSPQLFTGQADMFASTPIRGLRDVRGTLGAEFLKAGLRLEYHVFRPDVGDWSLGHEWDLGFTWSFTREFSATAQYADYRAGWPGAGLQDTRKVWLTLRYVY